MLKLTNARMYDYPGTETDLVIFGNRGEIEDLIEEISENQNEIEFEGGEYYVAQMETRHSWNVESFAWSLGLVVRPLDSIY